jgi:hypothetical protein
MNPQAITFFIISAINALPGPQFGYGMGYGGMGMMNPMMMGGMGGMFWDEKTHKYVKGDGGSQQTQQQHK